MREPSSHTKNLGDTAIGGTQGLSVVIPAYNEGDSLPELLDRLDRVTGAHNYDMQVVVVDDGSTDDTVDRVKAYHPANVSSVTCIVLRSNLGKSAALSEGIARAEGTVVVTMDADLQDQPEAIPALLELIDQGYDVVSGWKRQRQDPFLAKKLPSLIFNSLVRFVFGSSLRDINCGLKAYRKGVWNDIRVYGELHRFIPVLAAHKGYRVGEVEVEHHPRKYGTSKYGASRFAKGMLDMLTVFFLNRYSRRPLHFFGWLGFALFFLGFIAGTYLTALWLMDVPIGNRPLLQLSVLLMLMGVQVTLFGLLSQLQVDLFYRDHSDRSHVSVVHTIHKASGA